MKSIKGRLAKLEERIIAPVLPPVFVNRLSDLEKGKRYSSIFVEEDIPEKELGETYKQYEYQRLFYDCGGLE